MVIGQPSMQRVVQGLGRRLDPSVGEFGQFERVSHPLDHRLDHPPAADAEDVADHRVELDVGLFQGLLDPLDLAGLLARNSERNSWISRSGTKLALISPQLTKSAIHVASFMSVLRPGTFLMCAALATISSNLPSLRMFHTGFQ